MNDSELLTAVREQRNKIPMTVPVAQVISRGRAVRARRRIAGLAAALAAAAGVAVAVTALLPATGPATRPAAGPAAGRPAVRAPARLAAWTVVKQPGGTVSVTIHELYYPAGLQRTLRAAGVPASVTFYASRRYPSWCRAYPASRAMLSKVFLPHPGAATTVIVIRPSALPAGAGVYLNDTSNPYGYVGLSAGLVRASMRCTGS